MDQMIGRMLDNRYELLELIGEKTLQLQNILSQRRTHSITGLPFYNTMLLILLLRTP